MYFTKLLFFYLRFKSLRNTCSEHVYRRLQQLFTYLLTTFTYRKRSGTAIFVIHLFKQLNDSPCYKIALWALSPCI